MNTNLQKKEAANIPPLKASPEPPRRVRPALLSARFLLDHLQQVAQRLLHLVVIAFRAGGILSVGVQLQALGNCDHFAQTLHMLDCLAAAMPETVLTKALESLRSMAASDFSFVKS